MKSIFFISLFYICNFTYYSQDISSLSGNWQGIMYKNGDKTENCAILYLNLKQTNTNFEGFSRHEMPGNTAYAYSTVKGKFNAATIELKEAKFSKKKDLRTVTWCIIDLKLKYDDSTGYLSGTYASSVCKNNIGKVVLFKVNSKFDDLEKKQADHFWTDKFIKDYKAGLPAPNKLLDLRTHFNFKPIYYETDKDSLQSKYYDYLSQMAIVIKGHSDLRIKVTGNTDADGSLEYNQALSKRRAEGILKFFKTQGLSEDKIVIDFKGETNPVSDNKSTDGKQMNRRVEFSFI
jgi:OOP family OmpA-OmpF porin